MESGIPVRRLKDCLNALPLPPKNASTGLIRHVLRQRSNLHLYSMLDLQDLDRGLILEDKLSSKLNELCKLCGKYKLIPDSMKLKDDDIGPMKVTKHIQPSQMFQSTFKGREVAVRIVRLHVPRKVDETMTVSTRLCTREPRFQGSDGCYAWV